jgi:asparaginyl-tRNA synthetase
LKDLGFLVKSFQGAAAVDTHLSQLELIASSKPFERITYTDAVKMLRAAPSKIRKKWNFPVEWGNSLQTEHERFLADKLVQGPVFVTDYPAKIKPFYMRNNGDGNGDSDRETVACCDLVKENAMIFFI